MKKHGHNTRIIRSTTYNSWAKMIQRCTNSNSDHYHLYGGRGITVCERWLVFENFLKDMGERPEGTSLDRKNTEGIYKPDNCKWSTKREQQQNLRFNHNLTFNEETKCIQEWARCTHLPPSTITYRLKIGWSIEKTLTTQSRKKPNQTLPLYVPSLANTSAA